MQTFSLNTAWQFRRQGTEEFYPAQVPGCVHTDLHSNGLIPDPFWGSNELELQWIEEADWEYTTTFHVPEDLLSHENVDLVAGGLDTLATIILNGQEVARTENMFVGYRFRVNELLRPGLNELTVQFSNPMEYIRARLPIHSFKEWNDPVGGSSNIRRNSALSVGTGDRALPPVVSIRILNCKLGYQPHHARPRAATAQWRPGTSAH
jgi:beta-mannosidase